MKTTLSVLSLASMVFVAGSPALADEHDPVATAQSLAAAWDEAFNAGDAMALAAMYAEDARLSPGDGRILEGRQAVQDLFQGLFDYGVNNHMIEVVHASGNSDMLYMVGRWTANGPEQDGNIPTFGGANTVVFHKDGDGNWQPNMHIWNSNAE
jgi:uncharacterized protein (TIGR02246 family)